MAEYIGKEKVLKIIYDIKENKEIPKNYGTLLDIIRLVRNIPTADVVEVVRCKDCIHYKDEWCEILKAETPIADGFCCYGERKCDK